MNEAYIKYFPKRVREAETEHLKKEVEFIEFQLPIIKAEIKRRNNTFPNKSA